MEIHSNSPKLYYGFNMDLIYHLVCNGFNVLGEFIP